MENSSFLDSLIAERDRLDEVLIAFNSVISVYIKDNSDKTSQQTFIHIGSKIKDIVDQSPISVTEFAKRCRLTRDGAYKIFNSSEISTGRLQKISIVLNHDFFKYYSESIKL